MQDEIEEIGIDDESRLYIKPSSAAFPMIYREAMEVHWNKNTKSLYGGIPRQWSHFDWYKQIIKGASIQGCLLKLSAQTKWVNIPQELKAEIEGQNA